MKKLVSIVLTIVMVLSVILSIPTPVAAESLYIRKIVSVVYDDSGSMEGSKWAYANYAMQSFCGMLNSEDQLFITYMSHSEDQANYSPEKINLSAGSIQDSVDSIRSHRDSGSTPYSAVDIAYNKLKSVNDSNPNTQYWLVVITDGAFNEHSALSNSAKKDTMNQDFKDYVGQTMPNGTYPQVTFLGIGGVVAPDENPSKGIYTYTASNADGIIDAMSDMADRISGRTRVQKDAIQKIDDNTLQVSSAIPLLNIAVFAQGSNAKVTKAVYTNESNIPISRNVSLSYPGYSDLVGGAFLVGDSKTVIGSGTYNITFDQKIDLDDVIVLFEPALEMRMSVSVNGKQISDYSELDNTMESDKVSVSCKIYEMGTNTEIDPSLLPPGTKYEITVSEGGVVTGQASGKDMVLKDYALKNVETTIKASVLIEGFSPIDYSTRFTPSEYVSRVNYTIQSSFLSDVRSVKRDKIGSNKDLAVCFTVYADGVAITDPEAVRALKPSISTSPQGNDGSVVFADDGKIVYTPNAASAPVADEGSFDVEVKCTLDNGVSASEVYTVLIATYEVIPVAADDVVKKTELYNNDVSVSFYITKDGVKLGKEAVEKNLGVLLNEEYAALKKDVTISADGTITVTPYSEERHDLTFWNWWTNWAYYFGLESKDITVTLSHGYGSAQSTIDIVDEDIAYLLLNVYLPLVIEIIALAFLIAWIILVVTKPRYLKSATLYVGAIRYDRDNCTHIIRDFTPVKLEKYNKIKKGNGRLKFKKKADIVNARGVKIRADHGGRIICAMTFPWYKGRLTPADSDYVHLNTPALIADHITRYKRLEVCEFAMTEKISNDYESAIAPGDIRLLKYIVVPDPGANGVGVVDDRKVIKSGKIFVYVHQ